MRHYPSPLYRQKSSSLQERPILAQPKSPKATIRCCCGRATGGGPLPAGPVRMEGDPGGPSASRARPRSSCERAMNAAMFLGMLAAACGAAWGAVLGWCALELTAVVRALSVFRHYMPGSGAFRPPGSFPTLRCEPTTRRSLGCARAGRRPSPRTLAGRVRGLQFHHGARHGPGPAQPRRSRRSLPIRSWVVTAWLLQKDRGEIT